MFITIVTKCYYTCDLYYICDQLLHLCLQQHLDDISSWKCSILGDPGAVSRVGRKGGTKEPLCTDSHRTISKNSSGCRLVIGHKKCFVLLCLIGEQFLLSSFREFVHDGYCLDPRLVRLVHQACACKGNFYFLLS